MEQLDTTKLKQALIDAFVLDAEETIQSCPEPLTVSEAHLARMQEIVYQKPKSPRRRKLGRRLLRCWSPPC